MKLFYAALKEVVRKTVRPWKHGCNVVVSEKNTECKIVSRLCIHQTFTQRAPMIPGSDLDSGDTAMKRTDNL